MPYRLLRFALSKDYPEKRMFRAPDRVKDEYDVVIIGGGDVGRPLREILLERLGVGFHPASSCAIGQVVDERLNVLGVEGLMVADASVFPENIANNLNMSCYMVGERAAAFVAGSG